MKLLQRLFTWKITQKVIWTMILHILGLHGIIWSRGIYFPKPSSTILLFGNIYFYYFIAYFIWAHVFPPWNYFIPRYWELWEILEVKLTSHLGISSLEGGWILCIHYGLTISHGFIIHGIVFDGICSLY